MSLSSRITAADYSAISVHFNRYLGVCLLLFGIIGNILSCLVFSQRKLRSNPCVLYFLIASISNIMSLVTGIPPRMFRDWNLLPDLTETSPVLCKLRVTVLFTTRNISSWLLVFATIDRFLVSSNNVRLRYLSDLKRARHYVIGVCLLSSVFWSESLYCFDANLTNTPVKCYAKSDACRIINDLSQASVTTLIPSLAMLLFGLGTIRHIHQAHKITPLRQGQTTLTMGRIRKTDHSLTRMLLLQVMLLTIFNMPQATQKFFLTATFYEVKSPIQKAMENLFLTIALLCTYVPNCLPFYLYTVTASVFRKIFFELLQKMIQRLKC